ncbi:hypothetical protein L1887_52634 [Cichorium endivia]|nr:hypothetical protein L1887_52634 [Cichorium endivia]
MREAERRERKNPKDDDLERAWLPSYWLDEHAVRMLGDEDDEGEEAGLGERPRALIRGSNVVRPLCRSQQLANGFGSKPIAASLSPTPMIPIAHRYRKCRRSFLTITALRSRLVGRAVSEQRSIAPIHSARVVRMRSRLHLSQRDRTSLSDGASDRDGHAIRFRARPPPPNEVIAQDVFLLQEMMKCGLTWPPLIV